MILYKLFTQGEDETDEDFKQRKKKAKLYKKAYEQIGILSMTVKGEEQILNQALDKFLEEVKVVGLNDTADLFQKMKNILQTNPEVNRQMYDISAVYLLNSKSDDRKYKKAFIKPLEIKARDSAECVSMYSKYISTYLDVNYNNFKQSIENKNYIENECWINTLMDYYGDTILSPDRSLRYRITREKLLTILNVSEEIIKEGLTVYQVVPFFEKFKLCLKVFNELGRLIFKYIPDKPNKDEKRCYVQLKGNHIYTMNNNLQTLILKYVDDEPEIIIYAPSPNYYINEDSEPVKAKMITSINDIPNIINNLTEDDKHITLIHNENDLIKCCFDLIKSGYHPKIKFLGNRLTHIYCEFNEVKFIIQTQHLVKDEFDGVVCVNSEDIYNNMNRAMCSFHKALFIVARKSFYSDIDIQILDEYRTVANVGLFNNIDDIKHDLIEIDISKAYTYALSKITKNTYI